MSSPPKKAKSSPIKKDKIIVDDEYFKNIVVNNKITRKREHYLYTKYGNIFLEKTIRRIIVKSSFDINNFIRDRINTYNNIIKYVEKTKIDEDTCFDRNLTGELLTIQQDKIILDKPLNTASKSVFGFIYIGNIDNNAISIKISKYNSPEIKNEISMLKNLRKLFLNNECPHFPIMYYDIHCKKTDYEPLSGNISYSAIISELANGDLKIFLSKFYDNYLLLINAIEQIIMSILYYNILTKNTHDDCHYGNFLYFKIPEGGYLHYKIDGKDYYIKNLGYLWIIWDFGLTKKTRIDKSNVVGEMTDMYRILYILSNMYNENPLNIDFKMKMMKLYDEYVKNNNRLKDLMFKIKEDNMLYEYIPKTIKKSVHYYELNIPSKK